MSKPQFTFPLLLRGHEINRNCFCSEEHLFLLVSQLPSHRPVSSPSVGIFTVSFSSLSMMTQALRHFELRLLDQQIFALRISQPQGFQRYHFVVLFSCSYNAPSARVRFIFI